jgi:hypothetical protein
MGILNLQDESVTLGGEGGIRTFHNILPSVHADSPYANLHFSFVIAQLLTFFYPYTGIDFMDFNGC